MAAKRRKRVSDPRPRDSGEQTPPEGASERQGSRGLLPLSFTLIVAAISFSPRVSSNPRLQIAFWLAVAVLAVWHALLVLPRRSTRRTWALEVALKPQHYIQAMVQIAVLAYWGWFWSPVYDFALLIGAQLAFAYAFDILLSWTRRDRYVLGFGPFPIIFSINLFLWFRDDWFALQFLMVGVGFLGKELIRWNRGGRRVHIFNPSAFALGLVSLVLIATNGSDITWGQEIASTLTLAPNIYLYLFGLGLVVMYFFSITLVAGSAAATLFALSALWAAWSGVPYFLDSEIPAAVFLGLHLLITDPSTSPRTKAGKVVFGSMYGVGVFALYSILSLGDTPTFYDKLLCVPILNLSVRAIDRWVPSVEQVRSWAAPVWAFLERPNLVHMGLWVLFFGAMAATGRTDGMHRGDSLPFWEIACAEGGAGACDRLVEIETTYCGDNSAWACNALGNHYRTGAILAADADVADRFYGRACELRLQVACDNLLSSTTLLDAPPRPLDLRLLLREGGTNLMDWTEPDLMDRACEHEWAFACQALGRPL